MSYENPLPGVWEIEVESRRTSPALVNPFNLTARIQGVTVDPATVDLPSVDGRRADAGDLDGHEQLRSGDGHG